MNQAILEAAYQTLAAKVRATGDAVKAFPHEGPMGLPSEAVRLSPEYRAAKAAFQDAFNSLRSFNAKYASQMVRRRRA
jgi:hypothetical protein